MNKKKLKTKNETENQLLDLWAKAFHLIVLICLTKYCVKLLPKYLFFSH